MNVLTGAGGPSKALPRPPGEPGRRGGPALNRALDPLAVLLIAFAVWRIFIAPRLLQGKLTAVPAPAVAIPLMGGGTFQLARERGQVVFLDFWASWCEPCKMSIPLIQRFEKDHPGSVVISVNAGETVAVAAALCRAARAWSTSRSIPT